MCVYLIYCTKGNRRRNTEINVGERRRRGQDKKISAKEQEKIRGKNASQEKRMKE